MKQKMIYAVLLLIAVNLPHSSKECARALSCSAKPQQPVPAKQLPAEAEDQEAIAATPFSRLVFNL